jgi:hypothetical protein
MTATILRRWASRIRTEDRAAYTRYVERTGIGDYGSTEGYLGFHRSTAGASFAPVHVGKVGNLQITRDDVDAGDSASASRLEVLHEGVRRALHVARHKALDDLHVLRTALCRMPMSPRITCATC